MKTIHIILALTIWTSSYSQTTDEMKKVTKFKMDFLKQKDMYKEDTLYISTAMLVRERLPNVRRISTFPKNKKIKHDEYFYNDTKILESNYSYKQPNGELTGITKQYNKKGELEYIQNHDKGTWEVIKFDNYPYYNILQERKKTVDSLIISTYGQSFFDKYVIWSPEGSAFYKEGGGGATWYNYQEWKPIEFLLRYSIKLSEEEIYNEQFEVHLDSLGKVIFPFDNYEDIKGFEKLEKVNDFVLNKEKTIEKAKLLGLTENDTTKALTFLTWKYNKEPKKEIYNGHFIYSVAFNSETILHKPINGRNRVEYKFEVYNFNPWTGQFIDKQKMKSFREWEKISGMSTGLLPD